jgi:hypothetical protein
VHLSSLNISTAYSLQSLKCFDILPSHRYSVVLYVGAIYLVMLLEVLMVRSITTSRGVIYDLTLRCDSCLMYIGDVWSHIIVMSYTGTAP